MLKASLKKVFTALVFLQGLLIVSGGAVRITGSGLGCPTWPTCTGNSYTPVPHQAQGQLHAWIEFGNRLIAWLIFIFAALAIIGTIKYLKIRPDYGRLRFLAICQGLGFVAQVILGGITVLTKLNPIAVSGHFLLSIPLLSGALSLRERYLYRDCYTVSETTRLVKNIFIALVIGLLIVGTVVTGSGPLAGDLAAKRYPFDAAGIAHLHSYLGISVLILLIGLWLTIRLYEDSQVQIGFSKLIIVTGIILILQGAIGYRQFALGLPEILVGLHIFGSALTWAMAWKINLKMRRI